MTAETFNVRTDMFVGMDLHKSYLQAAIETNNTKRRGSTNVHRITVGDKA